jgi:hypothetical protein
MNVGLSFYKLCNIDSEKIERKAIKNIYAIKHCLEKFDF